MIQSIVLSGVAVGCIYALIGITYNVMFSASRVFSFTAGTLGMLGGVLGSLFISRMGLPVVVGLLLALAGGALLGVVTEVTVRILPKPMPHHEASPWPIRRARTSPRPSLRCVNG